MTSLEVTKHDHSVIDSDVLFKVDAFTRDITTDDAQKKLLIQGDHNSERFSFEIPRYIEGHDMLQCNVVQVIYLNTETKRKSNNIHITGVYTVEDFKLKDSDTLVCSWLVSNNATQYCGNLSFMLMLSCMNGTKIEYKWNTNIYNGITVVESLTDGFIFEEMYVDIIEQWKTLLKTELTAYIADDVDAQIEEVRAELSDDLNTTINKFESKTQTVLDAFDDILKREITSLDAELETQKARMDTFTSLEEGSTTGDAELADIRVSHDGIQYSNAGEAVRKQQSGARTMISNAMGVVHFDKEYFTEPYEPLNDHLMSGNVVGEDVDLAEIVEKFSFGSIGAKTYKIDVSNYKSVRIPVFMTSTEFGNIFVDENEKLIKGFFNKAYPTGTMKDVRVPEGAAYLMLSISPSLTGDWYFEGYEKYRDLTISTNDVQFLCEERVSASLPVNKAPLEFGRVGTASYIKIDVTGYAAVEFPTFASTSNFGTVFIDEAENYISGYSGTVAGVKTLLVPANAKYILVGLGTDLTSGVTDYRINLLTHSPGHAILEEQDKIKEFVANEIADAIRKPPANLVLCAAKPYLRNNKLPFYSGYLFHTWSDDTLWYGPSIDDVKYLGAPAFTPKYRTLAMSPTDGRIIAAVRGERGSLVIFHDETTYVLFQDVEIKPMGWLYNSGIDFIVDEDGQEWCIFAEYSPNTNTSTGGFYVWRGKYPYTSEDDWTKVYHQNYANDTGVDPSTAITHFHMIRRDPWTNYLYLTSGDDSRYSKWWYSTDCGATWTLLTTGDTSGYEEHICRCINFIFTDKYVYFATDKGTNHCLNQIERRDDGVLDVPTRKKLCDLPEGQATNFICYVESPKGIFMYDRIDIGYSEYYENDLQVQFYSLVDNQLKTITILPLSKDNADRWGGHRGCCYLDYTNCIEYHPAMGFATNSLNIFELACERISSLGTIYYDISGVVKHT